MPNWVYTGMSVSGLEKDLLAFMDKAGASYTSHNKGTFIMQEDGTYKYDHDIVTEEVHESPLSFWNFKKPTDMETYFASATGEKPEGYKTWEMDKKLAHDLKFESNGWYDWNLRNWGTKWDACDVELQSESASKGGYINYNFSTAWSPAQEAFEQMVAQHPELEFTFICEEEQGWIVEFESKDGELVVTKELGIPESHADYVERDNVDGCICSHDDEQSEWFSDCPKDDADMQVTA